MTGLVMSDKPDKSIVVRVQWRKTHPLYKKQYLVSKRYLVHDEKNEAHPGDKVLIIEGRPLSARKRFQLSKIIERPVIREDQQVNKITAEEEPEKKPKEKE